jgi:multicomponent Na+:H+ antiporter subunit D
MLYGLTGTLNLADLHQRIPAVANQGALQAIAMMMLVALGIKAAVFPLFAWLPASYPAPPVVITAVFSGLLTKVGVYALIRLFTLVFPPETGFTHDLLLVIAVLTMVTGVLGAAAQTDIRRILSFHIVSQIGFLIMGLALATPLALAGAVFYTVHNIVAKANLFLVGGVVERTAGGPALARIGGLYRQAPLLAVLFLVPALALAGLPPLSGFWAKLMLIEAGLDLEAWLVVAAASVTGLLTLYSMTKIWTQGFWEPAPDGAPPLRSLDRAGPLLAPVIALALISVALGLFPATPIAIAERAATELLDPARYLAAVLGGTEFAGTEEAHP